MVILYAVHKDNQVWHIVDSAPLIRIEIVTETLWPQRCRPWMRDTTSWPGGPGQGSRYGKLSTRVSGREDIDYGEHLINVGRVFQLGRIGQNHYLGRLIDNDREAGRLLCEAVGTVTECFHDSAYWMASAYNELSLPNLSYAKMRCLCSAESQIFIRAGRNYGFEGVGHTEFCKQTECVKNANRITNFIENLLDATPKNNEYVESGVAEHKSRI